MKHIMIAAALCVAFTPAAAQTPPSQVAPTVAAQASAGGSAQAAKPAQPKRERMICESEAETGSKIATNRVCMTESQWKQHQLQVQEQLDQSHMNTQNRGGSPG